MKVLRLLSIVAIIGLSSCDSMFPFGKDISKKDIVGQWKPTQYESDGMVSSPTVEQRNDYIRFKQDKTFECLEKEVMVDGTWNFVPLFNVLNLMTTEDPDNCIPLTIESATETEMTYRMTKKDGTEMKVWLVR